MTASSNCSLQNLPQEIIGWIITISHNIRSAARVSHTWKVIVDTYSFTYLAQILRESPLSPFMSNEASCKEQVRQLYDYALRFHMAYEDLQNGLTIEETQPYPPINLLGNRNPPKNVFKTAAKIYIRLYKLSLSPEIDPHVKESFLMVAARYGITSVINYLPNEILNNGMEKALLLAVQNNQSEIVQSLLRINLNISADLRGSLTIIAVQTGNTEIVRLFLLDCDISDAYKESALETATENNDLPTIQFFLDRGLISDELKNRIRAFAVTRNRWDVVNLLQQM